MSSPSSHIVLTTEHLSRTTASRVEDHRVAGGLLPAKGIGIRVNCRREDGRRLRLPAGGKIVRRERVGNAETKVKDEVDVAGEELRGRREQTRGARRWRRRQDERTLSRSHPLIPLTPSFLLMLSLNHLPLLPTTAPNRTAQPSAPPALLFLCLTHSPVLSQAAVPHRPHPPASPRALSSFLLESSHYLTQRPLST